MDEFPIAGIDKVLRVTNGTPGFPNLPEATLGALFDSVGLTVSEWPAWVHWYEGLIAEAKAAAEFTVAYGFPPDANARTLTLLSLVVPYAHALKVRQIYDSQKLLAGGMPDAVLLSTYGIQNPERYQAEALARSSIGG